MAALVGPSLATLPLEETCHKIYGQDCNITPSASRGHDLWAALSVFVDWPQPSPSSSSHRVCLEFKLPKPIAVQQINLHSYLTLHTKENMHLMRVLTLTHLEGETSHRASVMVSQMMRKRPQDQKATLQDNLAPFF